MSFALRHGERDYPLGEGKFVIGRSESCQLCLNDPMASRNHVALSVKEETVEVEDLESRNGVFLNQERIDGAAIATHGDIIKIGSAKMVIIRRGQRARAETLVQRPVTSKLQAFGVLGRLADKALALGHGEEGERILGRQLDALLSRTESGESLSEEEFAKSIQYALKLGVLTRKGKWLDYLFRMHASRECLMDAELVNELYSIIGKMTGAAPARLRLYLDSLDEHVANYAPGERFVLKRLEGLEALLS